MQTFGDVAGTTISMTYDPVMQRLEHHTIARSAPAIWSSQAPPYGPVPADTLQTVLADYQFSYDKVGNPTLIDDRRDPGAWPPGFRPVARTVSYDDLYRLTNIVYTYAGGSDSQANPWLPEMQAGRSPVPFQLAGQRVNSQTFGYDWSGNLTASGDDANLFFDRSLGGGVSYGTSTAGPNQMRSAGSDLNAAYDDAGNLVDLQVQRSGVCSDPGGKCLQRFLYDWDEVGQLVRARCWDFDGTPAVELSYLYDAGGSRVIKSAIIDGGDPRYTAEVVTSLRLENARYLTSAETYERTPDTEIVYLAGLGRLVYEPKLPSPSGQAQHVFLELGDHMGSTSVVIDKESSELVQRTTFQALGGVDSDFRPACWNSFREPYAFTGKENDFEVGLVYFGARYYYPSLGRFISADPLATHALGADLNPYAYVSGRLLAAVDPDGLDDGCLGNESMCDGPAGGLRRRPPARPASRFDPVGRRCRRACGRFSVELRIRGRAPASAAAFAASRPDVHVGDPWLWRRVTSAGVAVGR
jgi:RHS repeat-associated protein